VVDSQSELVALVLQAVGPWLGALLLALARTMPLVVLVPTFSLAGLPGPVRLGIAVSLGLVAFPVGEAAGLPTLAALLNEAACGIPVALVAAGALWSAAQVGALADDLSGFKGRVSMPGLSEPSTPLSALMGLLASASFLAGGGAARVALALHNAPPLTVRMGVQVAGQLAAGTQVAVAIAAPLVVAGVAVEVLGALVSRLAMPAQLGSVVAPLKSVALLGILAVIFDRVAAVVGMMADVTP
jgi:type III secretory pathway component EscT